ncbi:beta-carotene 15,15'-monooxygenase [Jeotgalibacillus sp. R-1-5s-1]|uniref:beta-carotene 15,15'-monooxygenase n=1 Tax=Jeotgalibacillus sp. R-1-5s-1 TaxID=2555897 RepID=UPI001068D8DF|nr:beta-carotene 15,15'-monooxygenase [Jeotgalibacillus sp. R-1-5s-1]TFE00768.1 beta-carotene 15,15'-monooxygenase [Jeotgalibacillus sp. R-1-5s-1]
MVLRQSAFSKVALGLLLALLLTNALLYQPGIQSAFSYSLDSFVVLGSLFDLMIVMPLLAYAAFRITKKHAFLLAAGGLILANVLIPKEHALFIAPVLYTGLVLEGVLVLVEISLLAVVLRKIPLIKRSMRELHAPAIYTALPATIKHAKDVPIIRVFVSECILFYYAFRTFKKKSPSHPGVVTIHKKTSAVAINMMLIHAIIIETVGIHWWLHGKWPIISMILLILNIYSIIYFIADTQITRLVPIEVKKGRLYAAKGLRQQLVVSLSNIDRFEKADGDEKDIILFASQDFEAVTPQYILYFKEPVSVTLFYGKRKTIHAAAFRVDEPEKFAGLLQEGGVSHV